MPVDRQELTRRADTWLWDMLAAPDGIPMGWFERRFAFLTAALQKRDFRPDAAIVPALGKRSGLASVEIDGGRNVKYVIVYAREVPENWRPGIQETLTYRRDVAGTDLVYDVTGEFLQGKARPFECDLRQLPLRVYVILPFQVERLEVVAQQRVAVKLRSEGGREARLVNVKLQVQFLDAAEEPLAGRLPIYLGERRREPDWERGGYTIISHKRGPTQFTTSIDSVPRDWRLVVRSCLTGDELALPLELLSDGASQADVPLTSNGLQNRRAPQPVELDG